MSSPQQYLGLPSGAGLGRRPTLGQYKGLNEAIATLLCYARQETTRLATPLPKIGWFRTVWQPDWLALTWSAIADKNRGNRGSDTGVPQTRVLPDLKQKDLRLVKEKRTPPQPPTETTTTTLNPNEETQGLAPPGSPHQHQVLTPFRESGPTGTLASKTP